ncbi:MAG: VCBS repeat-containing protein [Balneolaceae bacterium]|nr:VCBS repeat-containing protein [Balneolaceae bacterium]
MNSPDKITNRENGQELSVPSISLPKGGGAIRGMGEKFAANPVTGTGSMTIPIATSPGRSGFGPELSLSYDSGAGNGPFGFGWNLSLPGITRKTGKGLPQYNDAGESDVFILSGAEDLVPQFEKDAEGNLPLQNDEQVIQDKPRTVDGVTYNVRRYRPRIEGLFARIERWSNVNDPNDVHWRSISSDNILTLYGKDYNSRIADPEDPSQIFTWLICETRDDKGNVVLYEYKPEDGSGVDLTDAHERNRGDLDDSRRTANRYLKHIRYGNRKTLLNDKGIRPPFISDTQIQDAGWMFEVVFDYGEHDAVSPRPDDPGEWAYRDDPFSMYRPGFEVRTTRICRRVLMFHHFPGEADVGKDCLVRSTDFTYSHEQDSDHACNPVYTFLLAVTQRGFKREGSGYLMRSMPPVEFKYTKPVVQESVEEVGPDSLENLPIGLDGTIYQWTDLHGEGISGILTEQGGTWFYKRNLSPINIKPGNGTSKTEASFAPVERVAVKPNLDLSGGAQFMDLAGDGQPDLVVMDGPVPGLYEHDGGEGWYPFRPFTSRLNRDTRDPNLRFLDLDGDGHADVLITEDEALVWHASLAESGFGPARRVAQVLDEEKGPHLVFADGTESIYLADMSGDGLTDLVRIRNGETCYWPNLGYGRFGAKVTMDHTPRFDHPDQFNQQRIRLADIDGTGTSDIIYLHRDGVRIYFNQSGNGWSESQVLSVFPKVDDLASITTVDLLGNGTACLVWSSPLPGNAGRQMRYVNLMGSKKPHLLISVSNNLGAETHIHYAPSTKFYLEDKMAGNPWITRLPFPVHVVERVETYDHISRNRFVTRYAYHHGYFDGIEREFHGFGLVEQWDTEEFASLSGSDEFPIGDNIKEESHVPPVLTRTWFHTGAYIKGARISRQFEQEYYREPGLSNEEILAQLLPDTTLPPGLSIEEAREACRALKGSVLRQEIYALDGTEKERHPYSVSERDYTIKLLQPRAGNRHSVFFVHSRETIDYHYERNPSDPRIAHALTLEVDAFGNVLQSAAAGYGRREHIVTVNDQGERIEIPNPGLNQLEPDEDQKMQTKSLVTYTREGVTNPVETDDDYRTPLPCETRTFELTGYVPTGPAGRFLISDFVQPDAENPVHIFDSELGFEETPTKGKQRRLIGHVRSLYHKNDLTELLALGKMETLALPGEMYQLAYTPGLIEDVYKRPLDAVQEEGAPPPVDLLSDPNDLLGGQGAGQGGYLSSQVLRDQELFPEDASHHLWTRSDADNHWWIPSGRVYFSTGTNDDAAEELTNARQHFFLPRRFRDPFHTNSVGTETIVTYDAYDLLMVDSRDPIGNRITAGERDSAGNLTASGNDYRVLGPRLVMDPNRNRTASAYDALGMVTGTAVMGKPEENLGDTLTGFEADLPEEEILDHLENPLADPHAILGRATTRLVYDLFAFYRTKDQDDPQPSVVYTLARETHDAELEADQQTRVQHGFSYSDGFGREIQQKMQAEPGPVPERNPETGRITLNEGQPVMTQVEVAHRWIGSGWTIFNNKEDPVRKYEPFFTDSHRFEFDVRIGVSPVLFYDPIERVVATLHPNHTWEKVIFDAWRQETWDVNDTVLQFDPKNDPDVGDFFRRLEDSEYLPTWHAQRRGGGLGPREEEAAAKAALHAETPGAAHLDTLGRPFLTIAHNKFEQPEMGAATIIEEMYSTRVELDIAGNERKVRDAEGRTVMRYNYHIAAPEDEDDGPTHRIHQASMEAGERWVLNDVTGNPIRAWDSRGHTFRSEYDPLRRPVRSFVSGTDPENPDQEILTDHMVYGEQHPDNELRNLRSTLFMHLDQAGMVTSEAHDFKGNLLRASRRLALEYKKTVNWTDVNAVLPADSTVVFDPDSLEAKLSPLLETETFTSRTIYDALNRAVQVIAPHNDQPTAKRNIIQPGYNEANLLERVDVWLGQPADPGGLLDAASEPPSPAGVNDIDYNAKGQRLHIGYKNGASTRYRYAPETFRLIRLKTTRAAGSNGITSKIFKDAAVVQDLSYTFDPSGNITHIKDASLRTFFYNNEQVEPVCTYTYDSVYRLIRATGREHIGQTVYETNPPGDNLRDYPFAGLAHPNDLQALQNYIERYKYDKAGNIDTLIHTAANGNRTRNYFYSETSLIDRGEQNNRLSSTTVGSSQPDAYTYDVHGNITNMPHLSLMNWDYRDQLRATAKQVVNNGGTPETTWYVYDAGGERVRKVTERSAASGQKPTCKAERIYLGGLEIYREYENGVADAKLERETLHIMDDRQRIALVETRTKGDDPAPEQMIRYQFGNHLGSASLELDENAQFISYEEYHPYGSTSYQSVRDQKDTPKRYRYTGKERDEESGLCYHGARYYAPWLGRWTSCDPAWLVDGPNLYHYASNNPLLMYDPSGTISEESLCHVFHHSRHEPVNDEGEDPATELSWDVFFFENELIFSSENDSPLIDEEITDEKIREWWTPGTEEILIKIMVEDYELMLRIDDYLGRQQHEEFRNRVGITPFGRYEPLFPEPEQNLPRWGRYRLANFENNLRLIYIRNRDDPARAFRRLYTEYRVVVSGQLELGEAIIAGTIGSRVGRTGALARRAGPIISREVGVQKNLRFLNHANVRELQSINEIGPAKARAIVSIREKHGNFKDLGEVQQLVSGIGHTHIQKWQEGPFHFLVE